jgi:epsilon-lactone hydrolase
MPHTPSTTIPARNIPLPAAISPQARDVLMALAANDVRGGMLPPNPADAAAWRDYVESTNAALLANSAIYGVAERPGIRGDTGRIAGVTVHVAAPAHLDARSDRRVYLEMHGGGMVFLEGEGCRRGSLREAERLGVRTVSVDYRVPPDHPYPAALDDCVAVYRELLREHRPGEIIVGGISGGGNLAPAMVLRARDEGLPLPAGLILLTPEVDLTESGDTFDTLFGIDPILTGRLTTLIDAYAPGADLAHPYLSPLFGDFTRGYPPTFLQSGTRDLFLSNTVRMHRRLRAAGIEAELHVWEGMPHGGFGVGPEEEEIALEMRRFMDKHWLCRGQT